jgi:hypothetical protein
MSLPIGAISMTDIATGYGRGAPGTSGFQNYYPYALGEYYRGGQYVPLYDNSSPNGTRATSQSNVDMNTLRGSGGYTHYSTIVAGTNGGKFPITGYYDAQALGSINDRTFKCYSNSNIVYGIYTTFGQFYIDLTYSSVGSGWYSVQVLGITSGSNNTYLRSNATISTPAAGYTRWTWPAVEIFTSTYTYNIRVRLTSIY